MRTRLLDNPVQSRLRRDGAVLAAVSAGVALVTGLISLLPGADQTVSYDVLYLLVVIGAALRFGSGAAVLASFLSFLAFDWYLLETRYWLDILHPRQWLSLVMFLITAIVTGQLTARLQASAAEARQRARDAMALSRASWAVASQVDRASALVEVLRHVIQVVEPEAAAIVIRGEGGVPEFAAWGGENREALPDFAAGTARQAVESVLEDGQPRAWEGRGPGPGGSPAAEKNPSVSYLPLKVKERVLGVMYLHWRSGRQTTPEEREVVASLANHAAVVLERDRLARTETQVQALAETDRLKTALLSMVSHNFRSPLTAIKATIGGLIRNRSAWTTEAPVELLQGMDHEVDRLNRMVANLLALSRLEADAWRPQREPASAQELVGAAYDSFRGEDRRRIRVSLDPSVPEVCLDPVQIAEALCGLLDNALRYSPPESSVELRVSQNEAALVMEVLDRGPGLPKGEEERVFEPFYRGPDRQESAQHGTGLGLPIATGLVEAHGGRLTAENREGGGAVFRITLPLARMPETVASTASEQ
jgi:two-component system sensor histidine kinase KdpD